jgi:hypothetical protein
LEDDDGCDADAVEDGEDDGASGKDAVRRRGEDAEVGEGEGDFGQGGGGSEEGEGDVGEDAGRFDPGLSHVPYVKSQGVLCADTVKCGDSCGAYLFFWGDEES